MSWFVDCVTGTRRDGVTDVTDVTFFSHTHCSKMVLDSGLHCLIYVDPVDCNLACL
jgi:hypothetical protein